MPLSKRLVESRLKKKGFCRNKARRKHRYFHYHTLNDNKISDVFTFTSHGGHEIGDKILADMADQCHLSIPQFKALIACRLDQAGYDDHLRALGLIP